MPTITGSVDDPAFRTERARLAGKASQSTAGVITRFLRKLPDLTPDQVETVRRALPPAPSAKAGDDAA